MGALTKMASAVIAMAISLAGSLDLAAQTPQPLICPAPGGSDAGVLRKLLRGEGGPPMEPALDFARLRQEQPRPLSAAGDGAVCARLNQLFQANTQEQRSRPKSYYALGDYYVVILLRDPGSSSHSEFGAAAFFDRDLKFIIAYSV